jgi:hypothetical protein
LSKSGEIDLMETIGHVPYKFIGAIYKELYSGVLGFGAIEIAYRA